MPEPGMTDPIREGIQKALDQLGDGFSIAHYVVAAGIERVTDDGIETIPWLFTPDHQPDYVTDGLLCAADGIRTEVESE